MLSCSHGAPRRAGGLGSRHRQGTGNRLAQSLPPPADGRWDQVRPSGLPRSLDRTARETSRSAIRRCRSRCPGGPARPRWEGRPPDPSVGVVRSRPGHCLRHRPLVWVPAGPGPCAHRLKFCDPHVAAGRSPSRHAGQKACPVAQMRLGAARHANVTETLHGGHGPLSDRHRLPGLPGATPVRGPRVSRCRGVPR